jgi:LPPG:FO 2-phospho-L-lactate transferase
MSDQPVETRVEVDGPDGPLDLGFQDYWVGRQARDPVRRVRFQGIEQARPAPGVLEAIAAADGIVLCPSNPVVSIAPILAVPGLREAVAAAPCRVAAVTPIVGGAPVRGMADKLLPAWGAEVSALGVAGLYAGLADAFVLDAVDADQAPAVAAIGLEPVVVPTLMRTVEDAAALAKATLEALWPAAG